MEKNCFNENFNISYLDKNVPKPDFGTLFNHYKCSIFVYSFVLIFLIFNPFFNRGLTIELRKFAYFLYYGYIFIAPIIYIIFKPKSVLKSHNVEICKYFKRIFMYIFSKKEKFQLKLIVPNYLEKQSMMLMFIKVFFGSIMIKGILQNINFFSYRVNIYQYVAAKMSSAICILNFEELLNIFNTYSNFIYSNIIVILFSIDLLIFSVGYLTELNILKNKIKMVETSFCGILFCLLCYPPFNFVTHSFLGWNQNDNSLTLDIANPTLTSILKSVALFFLIIYVLASVALGTKASNLTNRGIVSRFPYNIVRHPAYISKNIFWLCTTIPFFCSFNAPGFSLIDCIIRNIMILLSYLTWFFIYTMRAVTEEKFLSQDPDYIEYCKKVKYRFIPYLY